MSVAWLAIVYVSVYGIQDMSVARQLFMRVFTVHRMCQYFTKPLAKCQARTLANEPRYVNEMYHFKWLRSEGLSTSTVTVCMMDLVIVL